jgi:hypothetical protein
MPEVLRLENAELKGPFCKPRPYTPDEFFVHVRWAALKFVQPSPDDTFVTVDEEPSILALVAIDGDHPSHHQDVLMRHFGEHALFNEWAFGVPAAGEGDWRAGVKDHEQLLHWFPASSFRFFHSLGFAVSVYDVPNEAILSGDYQLLFDVSRAQLVGRVPLRREVES